MSMQQYCLRWNNHQPNFISVFSSLLNSESLVDVTLAAEGKHLQAHKVVLSACSSYFQSLFTINPCQHPIVILKDVKFMDLKVMVDFMYYGEVNVSQEQLPYILKTAEMLKIKGLAEIPVEQHLSKSHSTSLDRAELLTPGESNWSSDGVLGQCSTPSPCPLSPTSKRKRLRKSSTGSGSTERPLEDHSHPHQQQQQSQNDSIMPNPNLSGNVLSSVIKADPGSYSSDSCIGGPKSNQHKSESELHRGSSHESGDGEPLHQISLQVPQQHQPPQQHELNLVAHNLSTSSSSVENVPGSSSSNQTSIAGIQWNIMDQPPYPNPFSNNCQTSNPSNSSGGNTASTESSTPHTPYPLNSENQEGGNCYITQITSSPPQMMQKRKRSVNPQADENFIRALEAVRFGGIGFCKAARMYGVNNRTLWLEYKKRGYPNFRLSIKNRKQEPISMNESTDRTTNTQTPHDHNPPQNRQHNSSNRQNETQVFETKPEPIYNTLKTPEHSISVSQSESNTNEPILCTTSHPVALISSNFFEGKHVDLSSVLHRSKWEPGVLNSSGGINFQSLNFEHI